MGEMSKSQESATVTSTRVPLYVGLGAAFIAIALSVFGMVRTSGIASLNAVSLLLVVVIAGGSWGVISWAITTAVYDVESDLSEDEATERPEQ